MKYMEDGSPRGFCFIEYADPSSNNTVVAESQAQRTIFDGKWLDCKEANGTPAGKGAAAGALAAGMGGMGQAWETPDAKRQRTDDFTAAAALQGGFNMMAGAGGVPLMGGAAAAQMMAAAAGMAAAGGAAAGPMGGSAMMNSRANESADLTIFVGALPRTTTAESLTMHFSKFGQVTNMDLKFDQATGAFRGFGFVTFQEKSSADAVITNYTDNRFEDKWIDCKRGNSKGSKGGGK